jgi:hypothetical protein
MRKHSEKEKTQATLAKVFRFTVVFASALLLFGFLLLLVHYVTAGDWVTLESKLFQYGGWVTALIVIELRGASILSRP